QRLEHHRGGEGTAHRQDRRTGEVEFALPIAVHLAVESVLGEIVEGGAVQNRRQVTQRRLVETEVFDGGQHPRRAGYDAVATAPRQAACEDLEDTRTVGGAVGKRGL